MSRTIFILAVLVFTAPQLALANAYKINVEKSSLEWEGHKVLGSHQGNVKIKSGSLKVEKGALVGGSVEVDMTTITDKDLTDAEYNKKLVTHLKSEDFFSVDKFPVATLDLKKVEKQKDGNFLITADLTIKGTKLPITFPATVKAEKKSMEAQGEFSVDRTAYGIKYRSSRFFSDLGDKVISDQFKVKVNITAAQ